MKIIKGSSKSLEIARQLLGKDVEVSIDRPIGSKHPKYGFEYEVNYGYVPGVEAPDGEDIDAYYLGIEEPVSEGEGTVIAIIHRTDDDDDKLVVVPFETEMSDDEIKEKVDFQEKWFDYIIIRRKRSFK